MATFTDITDRREMLLRNKPECSSCADAGDDTVPATKVIEDTTPDSYYQMRDRISALRRVLRPASRMTTRQARHMPSRAPSFCTKPECSVPGADLPRRRSPPPRIEDTTA